jgi:hypothetical protein
MAERHRGRVQSLTLGFEEPLDWSVFCLSLSMLLHAHGERVLRVKGLWTPVGRGRPCSTACSTLFVRRSNSTTGPPSPVASSSSSWTGSSGAVRASLEAFRLGLRGHPRERAQPEGASAASSRRATPSASSGSTPGAAMRSSKLRSRKSSVTPLSR